jgi:hypothetical protein
LRRRAGFTRKRRQFITSWPIGTLNRDVT